MNKREVMKVENLVRNYKMVYSDRQGEEEIKVLKHHNPAFISLTYGAGGNENKSFELLTQIKDTGINTMPHFTCISTTKENIERNFGMPNPESYRKGIRFMKQAEKFHRPVITFIDTKGAYPGIGAEERGQGEAIASSMLEMASLTVPTISIIIGEGSSGGALALGLGNKVLMLENAIYSILSPEGYASILWKDASRAKEAAEKMKLTAKDLKEMNVIDEIIKEPEIEENEGFEVVSQNLKDEILKAIKKYAKMKPEDIKEERYQKFRNMGEFQIL